MLYNVLGQVHVPDNDSDDDLRAKEDVKVSQLCVLVYGPIYCVPYMRKFLQYVILRIFMDSRSAAKIIVCENSQLSLRNSQITYQMGN